VQIKILLSLAVIATAPIATPAAAQLNETADGDLIELPSCIFINKQQRCIQSATHYDDVKKTLISWGFRPVIFPKGVKRHRSWLFNTWQQDIDKYPEVVSCNQKPSKNCEFAFEWKSSHKYLIVWTESGMKDDHIMDKFVTPDPRKINPHNLQPMAFETFVGPLKPITFSD